MNINNYGAVFVNSQELFDALYSGKLTDFTNIFLDDSAEVEKFNAAVKSNYENFQLLKQYKEPNESIDFFDEANQCSWFMPDEYKCFPMYKWLLDQCTTDQERNRVDEELKLFIDHGMFDLLFYLKYLVDTMRANNIVWGVGRGSSVASYVLYLLGIHKINSIKYNLDIREFLK